MTAKIRDTRDIRAINEFLSKKEPEVILREVIKNLFKNKIAYVCSFGTESAIILHLISKIDNNLPIVMLNTHFLFDETIQYKDKLLDILNLSNYNEVFPDEEDLNKNDKKNNLWKKDVDECCKIRKVIPLENSIKSFDAWISGKKPYHLNDRQNLDVCELINKKFVINPLFNTSREFVDSYFVENNLPKHPLQKKGFLSIGCTNCTVKASNINDPRSGRWSDKIKTECGIHIQRRR